MSTVEERNLRMGAHRPHVIGGWDVRTATATQEWRQGARAESRWQGAGGPPNVINLSWWHSHRQDA